MSRFATLFLIAAAQLTLGRFAVADYLVAPDDAPKYQLSNFRVETDLYGRPGVVCDYRRTREGKGWVEISGKTPSGPLQLIGFGSQIRDEHGEIRFSKTFSFNSKYDYELFLTIRANWAGKSYGKCLVSNTVRIGNPGSPTRARAWNAEEKAAYERNKLGEKPPASMPRGFEGVSPRTTLLPGMPIKVGYFGEWKDAEVVEATDRLNVRYIFDDGDLVLKKPRAGWIAVDPAVVSQAEANPEQFNCSIKLLPGSDKPLPANAVAVPATIDLPRGTPVHARRVLDWQDAYVLSTDGGKVRLRFEGLRSGFDKDKPRKEIAIDQTVLDRLSRPGAAEHYAANVPEAGPADNPGVGDGGGFPTDEDNSALRGYHVIDRSYPIKTGIPRGAQKVPSNVELPPGSPVAYSWARKWRAASVVLDQGEKIIVKEDGSKSSFAYKLDRGEVIVQDKTLRKLARTTAGKAADLQKTLRTWTDNTGEHKVEARFVGVENGRVTLKTNAGREIKLPLERLSDEDRELLETVGKALDNPFE